jgi:hypothetical protein
MDEAGDFLNAIQQSSIPSEMTIEDQPILKSQSASR